MTAELPTPNVPQAATAPHLSPFHDLAYAPLMTRIKVARVKPLIVTLAIAVGVLALGNVVMLALVQKAQQDTVDLAAKVASGDVDENLLQKISGKTATRTADFAVLETMLDEIRAKEAQRDSLLAEQPEFAGSLPSANAPGWQAAAVQQLRTYEDQLDAQLAMLQKRPASVASSALDAPPQSAPAPAALLPAPSAASANPVAKTAAVKSAKAPKAPAKNSSESGYAKELTAALNRAARAQVAAPVAPAPAPVASQPANGAVAAPAETSAPASAAPAADAAPGEPGV